MKIRRFGNGKVLVQMRINGAMHGEFGNSVLEAYDKILKVKEELCK